MNRSNLWLEGTAGAGSFPEEFTAVSEPWYGEPLEYTMYPPMLEVESLPKIGWSWWMPALFRGLAVKGLRITFERDTVYGDVAFILGVRTYLEGQMEATASTGISNFTVSLGDIDNFIKYADIDITSVVGAVPSNNMLEVVLFRVPADDAGDADTTRCHGCRTLTAAEATASIAAGTMRAF